MALGLSVASDIASAALTFYVRGAAMEQTMQDRPLLRILNAAKKTFPGGKDNISDPVQGAFMSDVSGFFAGYTEDDALTFTQAQNLLRAAYPWKELHAGLIISWTELKKDGVTVTDSMRTSDHSEAELTRLTSILQNRLDDYGESWARSMNLMLWNDGSQDSKAIPGMKSIITASAAVGTTGGLNRATYSWWRHRVGAVQTPSASLQTLSRFLRSELRQLRRYGGKPNQALCGSTFIEGLELEVQEKGIYTQEGFTNEGKTDLGMAKISMRGLGSFEYDPSLDDAGQAKYCYIFDDRRVKLRPMEGEDNKVLAPERPYNYAVFLRSMTYTGGLTCNQLNANGLYQVA
jgi:hypothetical protein